MARVAQAARITLTGFDSEHIDHNSTIEDQVVLVFRAVSHYATVNGWSDATYRGIPGRSGPMVMKQLVTSLFPRADEQVLEKLNGLINQVLRKCDAAVCIRRPTKAGESPTWFVADRMPANIVVVALSHARRQVTDPSLGRLTPTYTESHLTPEEAGEDKEPGDVTVTYDPDRITKLPEGAREAFQQQANAIQQRHRNLLEAVFNKIQECTPVAAPELKQLLPEWVEPGTTHGTAITDAVRELAEAGRIVGRFEEDPERVIRAGGTGLPKGKRLKLWGPAPGPVPERTALPEGVAPRLDGAAWARRKKQELDDLCDKVIEALYRKVPRGENPPRSTGRIAEAAGLSESDTLRALEHLIKLDMVYRDDKSRYLLTDRRLGPRTPVEPAVIPPYVNGSKDQEEARQEAQEATVADLPPADLPVPPLPAAPEDLVADIHRAVDILAQRATGNPGEIERLREQNARLVEENERLQSAVASLKAALAALS